MAEIKSTLDLVMEKTKHLSLSKEEREAQRNIEVKGSLKGLVQKFLDGRSNQRQLKKELNILEKKYDHSAGTDIFKAIIIRALDLNRDNMKLFVLLREICKINTKEIESVVDEYQKKIEAAKKKSINTALKRLAEKHLISGSAVVPNLEGEGQLKNELKRIQSEYEAMLNKEKAELNAEPLGPCG